MRYLSPLLFLICFQASWGQERQSSAGVSLGKRGASDPRREVRARAVERAADAQNPLIALGSVGTPSQAVSVALSGNYAYVCDKNEIAVVNVQNPAVPVLVTTVTAPLLSNAGVIRCTVTRGVLSAFSDATSSVQGAGQGNRPAHIAFSLTNPAAPVLLNETQIPKRFFQPGAYLGNFAFVPTAARSFFLGFQWDATWGDLLAVDLTNFAAPVVAGTLRQPVVNPTFGGLSPMVGATAAGPALLYLGGSTMTGGTNDGAVGRLQTVDVTNPAAMRLVGELQIPGTVMSMAPVLQGTLGIAMGNTEGYEYALDSDPVFKGKLVFTTFDAGNRRAPALIASRLTDYKPGSGGGAARIGLNLFAFGGVRTAANQEILLVVDTTNPRNLVFREYPLVNPVSSLVAVGRVLYATTTAGLRTFDIPDADAPVLSACPSAVDVAFVVDRASGVAGQPLAEAVAGMKRFLDQMNLGNDRAAVISFTNVATANQSLSVSKTAIGTALDGIIAGGTSHLGAGIAAAQAELLGPGRNALATPVIVLLSDGRD